MTLPILSEPLFYLTTSLSLLAAWFYFLNPSWKRLFLVCLSLGITSLARYVGVSFIAAFSLSIFLFSPYRNREKFLTALSAAILSSVPLLFWCLRHFLLTGGTFEMSIPQNREGHFFPVEVTLDAARWFIQYLIDIHWLPQHPTSFVIFPLVLIGLFVLCWVRYTQTRSKTYLLPLLSFLFATAHSFFLVLIWIFRSVKTFPDATRFFTSTYHLLWLFLVCFLFVEGIPWIRSNPISKIRKFLSITCLVAFLSWSVPLGVQTVDWFDGIRKQGVILKGQLPWAFVNRIRWFPNT